MTRSYPWNSRKNPLIIPSGAKRNQITIQAQSMAQDPDTGEPSETWNPVLTVMAAISTVSSREMYQTGTAAQFVAQVSHLVEIDYPGESIAIAGGMQVLFGKRTFIIQGVENVQERNRKLNITCLEINGGAGC